MTESVPLPQPEPRQMDAGSVLWHGTAVTRETGPFSKNQGVWPAPRPRARPFPQGPGDSPSPGLCGTLLPRTCGHHAPLSALESDRAKASASSHSSSQGPGGSGSWLTAFIFWCFQFTFLCVWQGRAGEDGAAVQDNQQ